jgi:uncharacterized protein YegL
MKTMICLILDRSGSMAGRDNEVIGGVNTFLDEQKALPDPASIAIVGFDTGAIERCVVVIVTDGEENPSVEYTKKKVKALIQSRQDSGKWAFMYLGANVDSFAEAGSMGIARANTANYRNTAKGVKAAYSTLSGSVAKMRATGATVADNLGGDIKEDGSLAKKKTGARAAEGPLLKAGSGIIA